MNTPERKALVEKLIELRNVSREAHKLAQEDGDAYAVIVSLDPVVDGAHEALNHLGLGFMEYPPNADVDASVPSPHSASPKPQ